MVRYFFRDEDCAGHGNEEGTEMTNEQKTQIIALHKRGSSLTEVADKLGLRDITIHDKTASAEKDARADARAEARGGRAPRRS